MLEALDARYEVYGEFASGGMATIHFGRLLGPHGFARPVAIKRLHPQFAKEPDFVALFVDEARLSARLIHANIIPTLDVVQTPGELGLVMEYVRGESLSTLMRAAHEHQTPIPVRVAAGMITAVLHGLHAAHEAVDDSGTSLGIVHRDVSPHNILVGGDGIVRVHDFGIAKAVGRLRSTPSGEIKGKLAYMAPEQWLRHTVDLRADVYGASVVLWEALTGRSLFDGQTEGEILKQVLQAPVVAPSSFRKEVSPALDAIVMRGLLRDATLRYDSARDMAAELERNVGIASQSEIADWLRKVAGDSLDARAALLAKMQANAREEPPRTAAAGTRRIEQGLATPPGTTPVAGPTVVTPVLTAAAVARLDEPSRARTRRLRLLIGVAALSLVGGMVAWAYWPQLERPREATAVPFDGEQAQEQAPDIAEPTLQPVTPEPPTHADPLPNTAADGGEALRTARGDKLGLRRSKPKQPAPAQPAQPAQPAKDNDCKPYYYIDKTGIKRPKPWCL